MARRDYRLSRDQDPDAHAGSVTHPSTEVPLIERHRHAPPGDDSSEEEGGPDNPHDRDADDLPDHLTEMDELDWMEANIDRIIETVDEYGLNSLAPRERRAYDFYSREREDEPERIPTISAGRSTAPSPHLVITNRRADTRHRPTQWKRARKRRMESVAVSTV